MKLHTGVVIAKAVGLIGGAMCATLVGQLAQWSDPNDGEPARIQWVIIGTTTIGSGLAALVAFVSQSWGNYVEALKQEPVNGKANPIPRPEETKV